MLNGKKASAIGFFMVNMVWRVRARKEGLVLAVEGLGRKVIGEQWTEKRPGLVAASMPCEIPGPEHSSRVSVNSDGQCFRRSGVQSRSL